MASPYRSGSKISLNNRLKIGFIRFGGWTIEVKFIATDLTFYSLRCASVRGSIQRLLA
jgi:hypothetical protein